MTTAEIANKLVTLCREGRNHEAINELYADDIVSVEAMAMPGSDSAESHGKAAALAKSQWWGENHDVHGAILEGPLVTPTHFSVMLDYDVTNKPSGRRMRIQEIAVYTVANGKITREQFFYPTGPGPQ